ncbi:GNAT family N-acetyltransferase [Echinicola jeungdonensis]|uniref:GNAT family N-acetyltransferase n=1 Tax=Echinicola jeungdonensis TaxID=709343 RepID=A0ABV5J824_9BACT|nr:GNAT family N-acetyltransferase [Echinicola jeungdonensis]MDN3669969.1 GNAT family N-acetyltransferase [Echinicola jeungdonensis]
MIQPLPWDSKFFGLHIGRLELTGGLQLNNFKKEIAKFDLVYIFSSEPLNLKGTEMGYHGSRLELEINPPFSTCDLLMPSDEKVGELVAPGFEEKEDLFPLARESGYCSRFLGDPVLKLNFQKFYDRWMQLILDRKDKIWVCRENGNLIGMVTLQINDGEGKLGLMAVQKMARRKGVGKALMLGLSQKANLLGLKKIRVVTQGENSAGVGFYYSMGFKKVLCQYVYHWHNPTLKKKEG